jgi:hypothetical protein
MVTSLRVLLGGRARWLALALVCGSCGFRSGPVMPGRFALQRVGPVISGGRVGATAVSTPIRVVGTLTLVPSVSSTERIELPMTAVFLQDSLRRQVSAAKTQLDGKFHLSGASPGAYRVCWSAGAIGSGCGPTFEARAGTNLLPAVIVQPLTGVVFGKVLTADGRPCWLNDPFFKLDVSTSVSLLDSAGSPAQPDALANTQGEYAFGGVKAGRYFVRGTCEKSSVQTLVSLGAVPAQANLALPNHAPRLTGIGAFSAGQGINRASAGALIQLNATTRDVDGDSVQYLWRTLDGSGSLSGANSPNQNWQLGSAAGLQTAYLIARDGKGGYAYERFDLPVGATTVAFSGRVIDETSLAPISGAAVSVGSASGTTNAQGWFRLAIPPMAAPERYVLNISHPLYALYSRIADKDAEGNTYQLIRSQITSQNPAAVIDVVDTQSGGPCGTPGGQSGTKSLPLQLLSASRGRVAAPNAERPCRHRGAHITLPAGILVDANQRPAVGPVSLSMTTMNPARRTLPGDYRAVDLGNQPAELLSYGALFAQFRDASGNALNLRPGTTAQIRVPVSDDQLPSAQPTIALWSYDEHHGLWVEEGTASLQNTAEGWMYVGTTKHFSFLNMDVAGSDPAQATCVRFQLGASLSGWTNLVIRAYVSYGGTGLQVKETALDGAQYHAIYRIPYAPPAPPPNTLRLELRGTYAGQEVVLLNNIINTDAPRPKMTGLNLWPPYPYVECGDILVLEADPVNLPQYGDINATGRPAFLTGPHGQFLPADGEQTASDYYDTIDPGNLTNPTLSAWWGNHGFSNVDGSGGTNAAYLNNNDLGFGRDMNCRQNGADLACYVTNYGLPDQNPANADAAAIKDPSKRGATVAMEYLASEPVDQRVRFFVYAGGDPTTAGKLKFADLDGLGPKPVPHLCIVCHGGSYIGTNVSEARFREFDLPSFKYSGNRSWNFAPAPNTLTNAELTAFADLNHLIRDFAPATSPIKDLINNWYPGGFGPNTAPVLPAVPAGWSTETSVYHNVYSKSCRTCHIARDDGVANNYYTFSSSSDYSGTSFAVCGSPKVMPNAFVTYKNFWNDTQRVIDYKNFTSAGTCQ